MRRVLLSVLFATTCLGGLPGASADVCYDVRTTGSVPGPQHHDECYLSGGSTCANVDRPYPQNNHIWVMVCVPKPI